MIPEISCKFCNQLLTPVNYVMLTDWQRIECTICLSKIPSGLTISGDKMSQHTVTLHCNRPVTETLITHDNLYFQTEYGKKTWIGEYVFGGPMEIELYEVISIPVQDIKPNEPSFSDKLKLWLTFS